MKTIVTKIGIKKITEATIEKPLKITKFGVGDGGGKTIEPNEEMKSLVNEKYRDYINDIYTNESNLTIECVLKAKAEIKEGFTIREIGIYDEVGDLIAISQTPEQYRPGVNETVATEWTASVVLNISNTQNINISIPQTVYATVDKVSRLENKVDNLTSVNIRVKETNNFPKVNTVQEALDVLHNGTQNLINMNRKFYKMFIGIALTQFNDINPFANSEIVQWAWCEGQKLRVEEYPDLYKVLGNRWGGTANVDFNLPDARNRVIRNPGADMPWGYQEDAQQRITGGVGTDRGVLGGSWGVFGDSLPGDNIWTGTDPDVRRNVVLTIDSAKQVRTAEENRVKSLSGRTFMITKVLI